MEVREGYKKTEVGVIPDEWCCIELGYVSKYEGGSQPPFSKFSYIQEQNFIRLIQIRDYKTDKYTTFIPRELARRLCEKDDIMIGRYGPPIFQILRGIEGAYNVALMKAIPLEGIIKNYLFYTLKREDLFKYIELLSQRSSGQTGIDLVGLKSYLIALPPIPEQQAIASVLSDVDNLVSSLSKLINKKKNIKKGAMQELLTGKKRLKGFRSEWIKKTVAEFGTITTGSTPSTLNKHYWGGEIPWITPTDINEKKSIYNSERRLTEFGFDKVRKLDANTVLITCIASIGKNAVLRNTGACNQQINAITPKKEYNPDFIYYLFELNKQYLVSKAGITATSIISKSEFCLIEFVVPKTIEEQTAIANILSDMDAEIESLEQKLNKYKAIKQGMMHELLTGRIRLI